MKGGLILLLMLGTCICKNVSNSSQIHSSIQNKTVMTTLVPTLSRSSVNATELDKTKIAVVSTTTMTRSNFASTSAMMNSANNTKLYLRNKSVTVSQSTTMMMNNQMQSTVNFDQNKTSTAIASTSTIVNSANKTKLGQNKTSTVVASTSTIVNFSSSTKLAQNKMATVAVPTSAMMYSAYTMQVDPSRISTVIAFLPTSAMVKSMITVITTPTSTIHSSLPLSSIPVPTTPKSNKLLKLTVSLKYHEEEFNENLRNMESLEFFSMKRKVELEIRTAYENNSNFVSVTIKGFFPGSIISKVQMYFKNSTKDDVGNLNKTLSDYGKANAFKVETFQPATDNDDDDDDDDDGDDDDDDDDVILGLHWWQIGVVIAGVVVFILLITVIVLCCKMSRIKKNGQSDMSYFSTSHYETIDGHEEMKTLRASPTKMSAETSSIPGNGDVESGPRRVNMYSSSSLIDAKNDGLVNQTSSKVGKDNAGADVDENDYVTILDTAPGAGDVVKL